MKTSDDVNAVIDHVAAKMVAVQDDPELVTRIVRALPDQQSRLGWLIPQLTALSAIAIAAVVWSTRGQPAPTPLLPAGEIAMWSTPPPRVIAHEPRTLGTLGTQPSEPSEPAEPSEPLVPGDFDRSLPALPAVDALMVSELGIPELALTAETFSPAVTKEF